MAYNVKFLKGSSESFKNITPNTDTFYYIDSKDLYLGNIKLSNAAEINAAVEDIAANAEEISKIKTALGDLTGTKFSALVARMDAAETNITNLQTDVQGINTTVTDHGTRLTTVEGVASKAASDLATLTTDFGVVAEDYASKASLKEVKDLAEANQDAIEVLNGTGDGSVYQAVTTAIAEVVDNAPEDFDTLKEVAEWIGSDTTGAAQMQVDIAKLKTDVADHETRLSTAEGAISTLQSEMDAVEKLASDNKAAHEKNAADIVTANAAIEKNAADIVTVNTAVATEKSRAEQAESSLSGRLAVVEAMAGVGGDGEVGSIAEQIQQAKADAISTAKGYTDQEVSALESSTSSAIATAKQAAIDAAAASAAELYASKDQGALAATALQKEDITTGTANGTIAVDGSDVKVKGLGSAAYTSADAYEVAGAASAAQEAAYTAAKNYADGLAKNYDPAGSAAAAQAAAETYTDNALSWGQIQ